MKHRLRRRIHRGAALDAEMVGLHGDIDGETRDGGDQKQQDFLEHGHSRVIHKQ